MASNTAKLWREAVLGTAAGILLVLGAWCVRTLHPLAAPPLLPYLSTQWPDFGNNPWQDRFSPLPLAPTDLSHLTQAFRTPLPVQSSPEEAFPLEVDGRLYLSTVGGGVAVFAAATGTPLWAVAGSGTAPNRGVAVSDGRVFVLSSDNRLRALDASSGHLLWQVPVTRPGDGPGYFETTAPVVAGDLVVVGISGGDSGTRGFVEALSAQDGHQVWRFFTVPAPGQGWVPVQGNHGGGSVWTPVTVDPSGGEIFASVGNPSPDFYGAVRPGPNPYTDGVIALALSDGRLGWYGSEVSHDLWDYDAASPPLLFPLPGGGLGVGEAGKSGYWFEWNAATGRPLISPLAFVREQHSPPTAAGTLQWPGTWGGANYGPSAYDPETGDALVAGIEQPQIIRAEPQPHPAGAPDFGTVMMSAPGTSPTGSITAIDVRSGRSVWTTSLDRPALGGVTVTAGGVVLAGTVQGQVLALDAKSGKILWRRDTGSAIGSAPIVYRDQGRIYVVVALGGGGMALAPRQDALVGWVLVG